MSANTARVTPRAKAPISRGDGESDEERLEIMGKVEPARRARAEAVGARRLQQRERRQSAGARYGAGNNHRRRGEPQAEAQRRSQRGKTQQQR